mgnify:FL=1
MAGERERLLALALRCEKAEGPDRELDAAIMRLFANSVESDDGDWWYGPHDEMPRKVPAFTASLDAALTLVPEECGWMVMGCAAKVGRQPSRGATPALALASAALRARAEPQP